MFSVEQLNRLRLVELDRIARHFPPRARILELGAGTGAQASELSRRGFEVAAIDLADSRYAADQVYPVQRYDGRHIPFPDASFDIVFSSNVLEHVADLPALHAEIVRVLRPGGCCVHAMPTHGWKFWTAVSAIPDAFVWGFSFLAGRTPFMQAARRAIGQMLVPRHGERGTTFSELWLFHPRWWRRHFRAQGFVIDCDEPIGLFYTGNMVLGARLGFEARSRISRILGSAAHVFRVRPERFK